MDPERIRAITGFPTPRNVKHLKSFLGLCSYDRRFCKKFSEFSQPLLKLLKKGQSWQWGVNENDAMQKLKDAFLTSVMQYHPNPREPYYIQCDSSFYGIGGCLFQKDCNGERRVIAFCSRTLRGPELNYGITEKEALAAIYCLQQWRIFVLGAELTIITDHKSLTFLKKCRLLNSRLTRWTLYIQEYDFNIEYCPGKDNTVADALSRYPVPEMDRNTEVDLIEIELYRIALDEYSKIQKINLKNLRKEQEEDHVLKEIRKQVEGGESQWFMIHEGILFKKELDGYKICVPTSLIVPLMQNEHNNNGHFGPQKVLIALRRWFYWKKMRTHVIKFVRSCDLCQKTKISNYGKGPMYSVLPDSPGELICADLMGPLPKSRGGVSYLLAVIDAFSKLVALYPLKRATTTVIVNKIKLYIDFAGKPGRILTDNGSQFRSAKWKKEMDLLNITVSFTSNYFPQGNCTERINREIGRLLRSMCHTQHTRWAYVVPEVEKLLNQVTHDSTGFTPNEVHFQRTREFPKNIIKFPEEYSLPQKSLIIQLARERLQTKATRRQLRHNQGRLEEFKVGDKVYIRSHPLSSAEEHKIKKFFLIFEGPFVIKALRGANSYEVVDENGQARGIHNVYNLKKCQPVFELKCVANRGDSLQQGGNVTNTTPLLL